VILHRLDFPSKEGNGFAGEEADRGLVCLRIISPGQAQYDTEDTRPLAKVTSECKAPEKRLPDHQHEQPRVFFRFNMTGVYFSLFTPGADSIGLDPILTTQHFFLSWMILDYIILDLGGATSKLIQILGPPHPISYNPNLVGYEHASC
jgi:hypothetical protein